MLVDDRLTFYVSGERLGLFTRGFSRLLRRVPGVDDVIYDYQSHYSINCGRGRGQCWGSLLKNLNLGPLGNTISGAVVADWEEQYCNRSFPRLRERLAADWTSAHCWDRLSGEA
jgi:hypothetical protein